MAFPRGYYLPQPSVMYSTPQWGCAPPAFAAPQQVPCADAGVVRTRAGESHRHSRKHVGPNLETAFPGYCPGPYTAYPAELIAAQIAIAEAVEVKTEKVNTVQAQAVAKAGAARFYLFRPTGF